MCALPAETLVISKPIDVPTRETVSFLVSHLSPGASLLEVGCGLGHVGSELLRLGYRVVGIDADPDTVERANERGFAAIHAEWPGFGGGSFDAVAFTRSLHHIGALDPAIVKARDVLVPGGKLLIEDFARDEIDRAALEWFASIVRSDRARSLIAARDGELVTSLLESRDVESAWRDRHARFDLHSWPEMMKAVREEFEIDAGSHVPYLYRYLLPVLPETSEAADFVEHVFREEARLASEGAFVPIGRRIAAIRSA